MPFPYKKGSCPSLLRALQYKDPIWMTRKPNYNSKKNHIHISNNNLDKQVKYLGYDETHKSHNYIYTLKHEIPSNTIVLNSRDHRIKWKYLPKSNSRQSARAFVSCDNIPVTLFAKVAIKDGTVHMITTLNPEVAALMIEGKEAPIGDIIARWNQSRMNGKKEEEKRIYTILSEDMPICVYVE